jgi:hypothetical protein
MSTLVGWFADVLLARQAVLDLLTSGVARHAVSVVVSSSGFAPADAQPTQAQAEDQRGHEVTEAATQRDVVHALGGATTLTLPDVGSVIAAGPLAARLAEQAQDGLEGVLRGLGIAEEEARMCAGALNHGGALVATQADDSWDTIVRGVFRHSVNPALRAQEERVGPVPTRELATTDAGGPVSTSVGALTSGTVPAGWGPAGKRVADPGDGAAADE